MRRRRSAWWSVTRNLRYGLRRCRIGEASNPGPCRIRLDGVSEAVESLEQALTAVDSSDEELLVRSVRRRHVVRRVGELEQNSELCINRLDSFDELSMSTTRCHARPNRYSSRRSCSFQLGRFECGWFCEAGVTNSQFHWDP